MHPFSSEYSMPSSLGLCRPGGLGAFTWSLASGLDSWTPESELAEGLELVMGLLTVCLCPRPHVCAEQELTLVGRRQPCVRAFSRTVPVWRPGCGRQAWCVSHERRYVQGSRGPMWGSGFGSPPEQHGVQGGGSVAGAGLSWSQGTGPPHPTSAPHLRSRKALTLPLGRGHHGGYSQTVHPCSAATWGLVGVGRPRGERACEEEEGPCRETCWPSMQKGESGALTLLRSHLQMAAACP